ncbi:rod shape-determining protein MreD [Sphingobacterium rhinopitheci]|uniref:rod shape-determining protein MreD n=1 Tax=Sphingobacterium rhinopitheci TaxID=2781960 RepID=UPI001F518CAB|nr:rod shape-determining protein MreD [Sphingobacterium rhinopitheci]MCI0919862.1 rod shape-determining protein MreD [Sphingobacterium rhinopitheci]
MAKIIIFNIIRFILLVILQVALLKNVSYYNIATPFPYILCILLLPLGISNLTLFTLAFLTGITIDAFYDSVGVHTAACVALAYFRIFFLNITLEVDQRDSFQTPSWGNMKFKWYSTYILLATLVQHIVLFTIEIFSFENILQTLIRALLSTIFTIAIIFVISLLTYSGKNKIPNN